LIYLLIALFAALAATVLLVRSATPAASLALWNDTPLIALSLAGFVGYYLALYSRIVRFRSPGWLHIARGRLLRWRLQG
jgi:hypothetical protein